jgi:hydroxypyruvate isomerase
MDKDNRYSNKAGHGVSRRQFIKAGAATSVATGLAVAARRLYAGSTEQQNPPEQQGPQNQHSLRTVRIGRIQQSVCRWCYGQVPLETLAGWAAEIGLRSVELVNPDEWPILKKYGLICAMSNSHGITKGLNRKENHQECLEKIRLSIEQTAEAGFANVICFSGNREGMDDREGLKNCETAIKQVVGLAEKKGVTLCMELLNSKRNHKDYMCDRSQWAVELARRVGSPRFKLLYDIYHMQVQEGDVIATICEYKDYIGHYHTGGVPGRREIDNTQELNYPAIMKAIVETGFQGYVGQEFIPSRDPRKSLNEAAEICDV